MDDGDDDSCFAEDEEVEATLSDFDGPVVDGHDIAALRRERAGEVDDGVALASVRVTSDDIVRGTRGSRPCCGWTCRCQQHSAG